MRKVINGHLYNTQTARVIGTTMLDDRTMETVFRTKTGEYFIHYYSTLTETLTPITEEQALDWFRFHDLPTPEAKVTELISMRLDSVLVKKLDSHETLSRSEYIRKIITEYFS